MGTLILQCNSNSDMELMLILASKLGLEIKKIDNIEKQEYSPAMKSKSLKHNFMKSKGLWKNRKIDPKLLRQEAWKIQS